MPEYRLRYGTYTDAKTGEVYRAGTNNDVIDIPVATATWLGKQVEAVGPAPDVNNEEVSVESGGVVAEAAGDTAETLEEAADETEPPSEAAKTAEEAANREAAKAGVDDFTRLHRIGPALNDELHEAGYRTYADVSAADAAEMVEIDGISEEMAENLIDAVIHDSVGEAGADAGTDADTGPPADTGEGAEATTDAGEE